MTAQRQAADNSSPQAAEDLKFSGDGLDFLKRYEKGPNGDFSPTPYRSPEGGLPTIGWGHKVQPGEIFTQPLTSDEADALLAKDAAAAEARVRRSTKGQTLNQAQYDALVSFAYNTPTAFQQAPDNLFLKRLQSGDLAGAADRLPLWNKAGPTGAKKALPGLTRRRQDEQNLFLNGVYGA